MAISSGRAMLLSTRSRHPFTDIFFMDPRHEHFGYFVDKFAKHMKSDTFGPQKTDLGERVTANCVKKRGEEDGNSGGAWKPRI